MHRKHGSIAPSLTLLLMLGGCQGPPAQDPMLKSSPRDDSGAAADAAAKSSPDDLGVATGDAPPPTTQPASPKQGGGITPQHVDTLPTNGFAAAQHWAGDWGSDGPIYTGDLNGDGKTDVFMWRDSTKDWSVNLSTGTGFTAERWQGDWATDADTPSNVHVCDLNADGYDDVFMFRASSNDWSVNLSNGVNNFNAYRWGGAWGTDGPQFIGNFDGDTQSNGKHRCDILMARTWNGDFTVNISNGSNFVGQVWQGNPSTDGPVHVGDLDHNGKTDVFMFKSATHDWSVNLNTGSNFTAQHWAGGWGTDGPNYVGDFNGDGYADVMMWRQTDLSWIVNLSTGYSFITQQWWGGCGSDGQVILGDFNNDSKTDLAIWRDGFKQWMVNLSNGSGFSGNGFDSEVWTSGWGSDGAILTGQFDGYNGTDVMMSRDSAHDWTVDLTVYMVPPLFTATKPRCGTPTWENVGPAAVDETPLNARAWGGKVDDIEISSNFDGAGTPAMYLATRTSSGFGGGGTQGGGGIWRSANFQSLYPVWTPLIDHIPGLTDAQRSGILNVPSIAISSTSPQTIFAASNTIPPLILRSVTGGDSWTVIGQVGVGGGGPGGLGTIKRVAIDPSGVLYVASLEGLWVSENPTAQSPTFTNVSTLGPYMQFWDVAWYPFGSPATVFVSGVDGVQDSSSQTGIYTLAKVNGVWTFTKNTIQQTDMEGQPFDLWTALGIQLHSEPTNGFSAGVVAEMPRYYGGLINVFKVNSNGDGTFTWLPQWRRVGAACTAGDGNSDPACAADEHCFHGICTTTFNMTTDTMPAGVGPDGRVYGGGVGLGQSDGNGSDVGIQEQLDGVDTHVDFHAVKYSSYDGKIYAANDGGLFRFTPSSGPGVTTWESLNSPSLMNSLSVSVDYNPVYWNNLIVGQQDNAIAKQNSNGTWQRPDGSTIVEGDFMYFDPLDPTGQTVYAYDRRLATYPSPAFLKSTDGGNNFYVTALSMADPQGNGVLLAFHPTQRNRFMAVTGKGSGCTVFETVDGWTSSANTSDLNPPVSACPTAIAYVNGNKYVATSGGVLLQQPSGTNYWVNVWPAGNPQSPIVSILADPSNPNSLYLGMESASGQVFFKADQTDGLGWAVGAGVKELTGTGSTALSSQLTKLKLLPSSGRPPALYAATSNGVFVAARPNGASTVWSRFGIGFPDAEITDLRANANGHGMYAATYGRGVWSLTDYSDATDPNPNGGFETGNFSGWSTSGAATSIVSSSHTGSFATQAGLPTPTNGDSVVSQVFTIPSGATTFSIWYKMSCPDSLTYDWATVTLTDNITKVVTTVLPKTCATNAAWVNVTAPVGASAGHSMTLSVLSHDDDYPSDPTFIWYDDISVF